MINLDELKKFLYEANKNGYAGDGNEVSPQRQGFDEIEYKEGDWLFHDSYTGHYFAPGQEIVYFEGKPVWAMAYAGGMAFDHHGDKELTKKTIEFLKTALLAMDPESPFRGPQHFHDGNFEYFSALTGNIEDFADNEYIEYKDEVVFSQNFIGGVIIN
ncbi:MAG: DUF5680 domain-containing protein [Patescibacteria group bacterium]|jgi:hypothetical protein